MNLPKFLFVGTAKSGTTSIYHYLKQHPQVEIPMKETFFFMSELLKDNHLPYPKQRPKSDLILTEQAYMDLYRGISSDKVSGEIGTGYLYHHEVSIPLIQKTLGTDVKIAIILRNPMDRCFSSYMHFVKDLFEDLSFEDSLEEEHIRIAENWDFMWHHKSLGYYANQVKAYQGAFKNVKVWLYDDLRNDSESTLHSMAQFIGIDPYDLPSSTKAYNPSGKAKNERLQKFITHENPVKAVLRPIFRAFFNQEKRERIRKGMKSRNLKKAEGPNNSTYDLLRESYEEDILKLSRLIDRDLNDWLHHSQQA